MATWRKIVECNDAWPLYFDRDDFTNQFGRFCIQPVDKIVGEQMVEILSKELREGVYGSAVAAFYFRFKSDAKDQSRELAVQEELTKRLQELKMLTIGRYPLKGHLIKLGPGLIHANDLCFEIPVQMFPKDFVLIQLLPSEVLELSILVEWGKGEFLVSELINQKLPRGWIPLNRNYSPIREIRTDIMEVRAGPNRCAQQVIAEVLTDGSISPHEAIRRISFKLPVRPLKILI